MSGARIVIDTSDLDRLQARLDRIAQIGFGDVLDTIGATVESQIKRRISVDQEAPDGTPWAGWTDAYTKTRHAEQSYLVGEKDLWRSIDFNTGLNEVEIGSIGSNVVYAATHQFGDPDRGIPARPYIGLSAEDEDEIEVNLHDWIEELLS